MPFRPVSYPDAFGGQTPFRLPDCLRCLSSRPRGRDPRPPSPTRSTASLESRSAAVHILGPDSLDLPPSSLERLEGLLGSGQAGNRNRLAPPLVPPLLAPEVSGRPPHDSRRDPPSHPTDGAGERDLGRSKDSRGAPEAWLRRRRAPGVPLSRPHPARADQAPLSRGRPSSRTIGTLRRECFDYLVVLNERHAQRLLAQFRDWYNQDRVHLALGKDAPDHRPGEPADLGTVVALPRLGGLHHRYSRRAA
jgi:hypothetical protein